MTRDHEPVAAVVAGARDHQYALFAGQDLCCCIVASAEAALHDPHFITRGVFAARLAAGDKEIAALPVPVAPQFRAQPGVEGYPALGEANSLLDT